MSAWPELRSGGISLIRCCLGLLAGQAALKASAQDSGAALAAPVGTQAYAFRVNPDGLLLDEKGAPVAVADVPAYLKGLNISNVTVTALWIDGPDAAKKLGPTIQGFGGSFTKIIVKIWKPGDKTGLIDLAALSRESVKAAIDAAYPGRSFPVSTSAESLAGRPADLVPEPYPARVHYRYAGAAVVEEAAKEITRHFITGGGDDSSVWAGSVAVQSGAWRLFGSDDLLGKTLATRYSASVATASGTFELKQIVLADPGEIRELDSRVKAMIAAGGGGRVRALRADEMRAWWQFISYDITEPVFVLETANSSHRFIIGVNQDGIGMIDELNVLMILQAAGN
jgi:hypothetical protein